MSKVIKEMAEEEFDMAFNRVFQEMREQYPMMTSEDIQTIVIFTMIFKEKYLVEE
jgi:hypothetical protein